MDKPISSPGLAGWKRRLVAVLLFGISFGYVEAAVVTYLRPQFFAARATFLLPGSNADLFPMLSLQQLRAAGPDMLRTVTTELVREAATLVMLGSLAAAVATNIRQWLAFFLLAFGAWDVAYYVFLQVLIGWPHSLLDWDILFLLPVPWSGPVLAPVLVAITMMMTGIAYVWREARGAAVRVRALDWIGAFAGASLIFAAFVWDYHNIMHGGVPKPFHWSLFGAGELLWVVAVLHWARLKQRQTW